MDAGECDEEEQEAQEDAPYARAARKRPAAAAAPPLDDQRKVQLHLPAALPERSVEEEDWQVHRPFTPEERSLIARARHIEFSKYHAHASLGEVLNHE